MPERGFSEILAHNMPYASVLPDKFLLHTRGIEEGLNPASGYVACEAGHSSPTVSHVMTPYIAYNLKMIMSAFAKIECPLHR